MLEKKLRTLHAALNREFSGAAQLGACHLPVGDRPAGEGNPCVVDRRDDAYGLGANGWARGECGHAVLQG
ncbi:hypothetical protein [Peterkaempfera sp. SMS 1(5)a]|uniref:hypothetical protein n=1 Tax=Peterkaempfera podocarpi TaxID=3232308 RepID=UPI003671AA22